MHSGGRPVGARRICERSLRCSQWAVIALAGNSNSPPVLAFPLKPDFHIALRPKPAEFLSPLDQQNAVVGTQIIQAERFQFPQGIDAVKIDVIESGLRAAILMHQGKGGTGDVFFGGSPKGGCDALDQGSFSRAQIAAQKHQFRGREEGSERTTESDRLFGTAGCDLLEKVARLSLGFHINQYSGSIRSPGIRSPGQSEAVRLAATGERSRLHPQRTPRRDVLERGAQAAVVVIFNGHEAERL